MSKKCVIIVENYDDGRNMPVRLRSCLVMKIQESAENYLETILVISHRKGMVRSIDIVNELEFSKPSVSVAMKNLRENGYIEMDKDGYIMLLDKGREIAEKIYERHTTLPGEDASSHVRRNEVCHLFPYRNDGGRYELQTANFERLL